MEGELRTILMIDTNWKGEHVPLIKKCLELCLVKLLAYHNKEAGHSRWAVVFFDSEEGTSINLPRKKKGIKTFTTDSILELRDLVAREMESPRATDSEPTFRNRFRCARDALRNLLGDFDWEVQDEAVGLSSSLRRTASQTKNGQQMEPQHAVLLFSKCSEWVKGWLNEDLEDKSIGQLKEGETVLRRAFMDRKIALHWVDTSRMHGCFAPRACSNDIGSAGQSGYHGVMEPISEKDGNRPHATDVADVLGASLVSAETIIAGHSSVPFQSFWPAVRTGPALTPAALASGSPALVKVEGSKLSMTMPDSGAWKAGGEHAQLAPNQTADSGSSAAFSDLEQARFGMHCFGIGTKPVLSGHHCVASSSGKRVQSTAAGRHGERLRLAAKFAKLTAPPVKPTQSVARATIAAVDTAPENAGAEVQVHRDHVVENLRALYHKMITSRDGDGVQWMRNEIETMIHALQTKGGDHNATGTVRGLVVQDLLKTPPEIAAKYNPRTDSDGVTQERNESKLQVFLRMEVAVLAGRVRGKEVKMDPLSKKSLKAISTFLAKVFLLDSKLSNDVGMRAHFWNQVFCPAYKDALPETVGVLTSDFGMDEEEQAVDESAGPVDGSSPTTKGNTEANARQSSEAPRSSKAPTPTPDPHPQRTMSVSSGGSKAATPLLSHGGRSRSGTPSEGKGQLDRNAGRQALARNVTNKPLAEARKSMLGLRGNSNVLKERVIPKKAKRPVTAKPVPDKGSSQPLNLNAGPCLNRHNSDSQTRRPVPAFEAHAHRPESRINATTTATLPPPASVTPLPSPGRQAIGSVSPELFGGTAGPLVADAVMTSTPARSQLARVLVPETPVTKPPTATGARQDSISSLATSLARGAPESGAESGLPVSNLFACHEEGAGSEVPGPSARARAQNQREKAVFKRQPAWPDQDRGDHGSGESNAAAQRLTPEDLRHSGGSTRVGESEGDEESVRSPAAVTRRAAAALRCEAAEKRGGNGRRSSAGRQPPQTDDSLGTPTTTLKQSKARKRTGRTPGDVAVSPVGPKVEDCGHLKQTNTSSAEAVLTPDRKRPRRRS